MTMELHYNTLAYPILSFITFLPMIGALPLWIIKDDNWARRFSLFITVIVFLISLPLYFAFDTGVHGFQFVEKHEWIPDYGLSYLMGVDGISLPMILLTTFLGPICVLCSWRYISKRVREFLACLLLIQGIMAGVFAALDLVLFYIFWEAMLIPMFLMIAIWGGPRRIYAGVKFVLYTLAGSIFLLGAIIALFSVAGTFSYPEVALSTFPKSWGIYLFLAFFIAFAVKVPMVPVHTWLPAAHVEAPTAGSVILASVLLKMGTYGMLRFNLALTPEASVKMAPYILILSAVAVLYGGLLSLAQNDIKKLIAYSSVAHMGFVTLGIFSFNLQGLQGGMLQMINHGLTTGGLFLMAGMLYERTHSRKLSVNAGLLRFMPGFAFFLGLFSLSSLAFPGTASFVGEFLCISGAFKNSIQLGAWIIPGALLAAAYMLRMLLKLVWGANEHSPVRDINLREWICLLPLALFVIVFGFHPSPILQIINPALKKLMIHVQGHAPQALDLSINVASVLFNQGG